MRAVYCDGASIEVRNDLPTPNAGEGEVELTVNLVGICETDLQLARGYMGFQGILGHEFVGQTPAGKRVTAEINNPCGACATCRRGQGNHCPNRTVLGIFRKNGAMAGTVVVPTSNLHEIPDQLSDHQAVMVEPLAAAFRVPEQVSIGPNDHVAVLGDGKLGILCAWVARLHSQNVTLVGKHPAKLALVGDAIQARKLKDLVEPERAFDLVIEATGSPTGLETALRLVRPLGVIVLKTTIAGPHQMSLAPIVIDEVRVIGSRCGPFAQAIRAMTEGTIDVSPLFGPTFSLAEGEAAFRAAIAPGAKKVFLKP